MSFNTLHEMTQNDDHEMEAVNRSHSHSGTFSGIISGSRHRQLDEGKLAQLGKKQVLKVRPQEKYNRNIQLKR